MILEEILSEMEKVEKPVVKRLREGNDFHVLAIGMKKNVLLKEHKSDLRAKIVVIKGSILYTSEREQKQLDLFEEYEIPVKEYHAVEAVEDCLFLVIKG